MQRWSGQADGQASKRGRRAPGRPFPRRARRASASRRGAPGSPLAPPGVWGAIGMRQRWSGQADGQASKRGRRAPGRPFPRRARRASASRRGAPGSPLAPPGVWGAIGMRQRWSGQADGQASKRGRRAPGRPFPRRARRASASRRGASGSPLAPPGVWGAIGMRQRWSGQADGQASKRGRRAPGRPFPRRARRASASRRGAPGSPLAPPGVWGAAPSE